MMRTTVRTLVVWFGVAVLSACLHSRVGYHYRQITMANRSNTELYFVVVDPDDVKTHLGYLGPRGAGATAADCRVRFSLEFAISWEENDVPRKVRVDILQYEKKKDEITSFGFYYLGNAKWQVVAYDQDGKVVQP